MDLPRVCVVGATGSLGKPIIEAFLTDLKNNKIGSLHVTTSRKSELVQDFKEQGATIFITDYSDINEVAEAFKGIDVVVSTIGPGPDTQDSKNVIIEAMKKAGTKVYIPSEFGTNHYDRMKNYEDTRYVVKKIHFQKSVEAGIKTIGIFCGLFMEYSFAKWFGIESADEAEDWPFVGTGNEPVALTALVDLGRFTAAAAILATGNPTSFPNKIEVCSEVRSVREYASMFEQITGRYVNLQFSQLQQIQKDYSENPGNLNHSKLVKILIAEGAYDYSPSEAGNSLLLPAMSEWKLKTAQEFVLGINSKN